MSDTKKPLTLQDVRAAQTANSQIKSMPETERKRGPESDDRDIISGETKVDLGAAGLPIAASTFEIDPSPVVSNEALDFERFMADVLTIHLHDPGSDDEPQFAEVTVNGIYKLAVRGDHLDMPRSHVQVLAQAKHMKVQQKKVVNADGSMGYEERAVLRMTYPFAVMHDPAGKRGAEWLKQLLKNPT